MMKRGPYVFKSVSIPKESGFFLSESQNNWKNWNWQIRFKATKASQFESLGLILTQEEKETFLKGKNLFKVSATPYYLSLIAQSPSQASLRKIVVPSPQELKEGTQQMLDPLGERKNSPVARVIHRYPDRVLFLVTDFCSVYCRYCTRKHFTGHDQSRVKNNELTEALEYIKQNNKIKEVILSGGDPLTLSNGLLDEILGQIRNIEHVEIIRIGTRMPVVAPMRMDEELRRIFQKHKPIYLMHHFNHPEEITEESASCLEFFVEGGVPSFNQMVLLSGVNNDPALIYSLSRRLLILGVKPYYLFQCDPSMGTDHLRTSIEDSLEIQNALWGVSSGLAMPRYSIDIPNGGGKTTLSPHHLESHVGNKMSFVGWDGIKADYVSPLVVEKPLVQEEHHLEWITVKGK